MLLSIDVFYLSGRRVSNVVQYSFYLAGVVNFLTACFISDFSFSLGLKSCKSGRNQVQLRKWSWFEGEQISYRKSILLAYCFLNKLTYKHAIQETSICSTDDSDEERVLLTSFETVSGYYNYCREVCSCIVENESSKPIRGLGEVVLWKWTKPNLANVNIKGGD